MKKSKKQSGITLIALVVTIIVLLILAGVSIQMLAGQNSILARARQAQEETKKKEYEEELEILAMEIKTDMTEGEVGDFLTEFEKRIAEDETFKGASVSEQEDGSLLLQTEDGFIYKVTEKDIDYLGKSGEKGFEKVPEIGEKDLVIKLKEDKWTKEETVTIEVSKKLEPFEIEYAINNKANWNKYSKEVKVTENNTTIYARVVNKLGLGNGTEIEKKIEKIDIKAPTLKIVPPEPASKTITIQATATDEEGTETSGMSGIKEIVFSYSTDNGNNWTDKTEKVETEGEKTVTKSTTFEGLETNTTYKIKVVARDYAGNEKETTTDVSTIGTAPTLTIIPSRDYNEDTKVHSITLKVKAEDPEGGNISYKLTYGKDTEYSLGEDTKKGEAKQEIVFTMTNLEKYTQYYYKVEATDEDNLTGSNTGEYRTYCVAELCEGPFIKKENCADCKGSGMAPCRRSLCCSYAI